MIRVLSATLLLAILAIAVPPLPAGAQTLSSLFAPHRNPSAPTRQTTRLLGLVFSKTAIHSGEPVRLMFRLTHPAPTGGFTLVLESSDKALPLPKTLTIPAHAIAIGLTVTPRKVTLGRAIRVRAADVAEVSTKAPAFVAYHTAQLQIAPAPKEEKGGGK